VLALLSRTHIARCYTVSTMYPLNPVLIPVQAMASLIKVVFAISNSLRSV
jgi:hypothetical protein